MEVRRPKLLVAMLNIRLWQFRAIIAHEFYKSSHVMFFGKRHGIHSSDSVSHLYCWVMPPRRQSNLKQRGSPEVSRLLIGGLGH